VQPLVELARDRPLARLLRDVAQLLGRDSLLALTLLSRDLVLANRQQLWGGGDMEGDVARELHEPLVAGDEVGLAVDLDHRADLAARVYVALDGAFARLGPCPLGGLSLAAGAENLDRLLDVAIGVLERLARGEHAGAGAVPERLDVLGAHGGHAFSSGAGASGAGASGAGASGAAVSGAGAW